MNQNDLHQPVMQKEVLQALKVKADHWYLDATLGDGGHTALILQKGGQVVALDQDQQAINRAKHRLVADCPSHQLGTDYFLLHDNFRNLRSIVENLPIKSFAGILFDLGASTTQLLSPDRGFSFQGDAPLDMRMDQRLSVTAADLLAALSQAELEELFANLGNEPFAKAIAKAIVRERRLQPLRTTSELTALVSQVKPRHGKLHPATKVFQALRMAVNSEREALNLALPQALSLLAPSGRLVIISFHAGEDALVKNFLKHYQSEGQLDILTPKPLRPTKGEVQANPRSRSARLRTAQKLS